MLLWISAGILLGVGHLVHGREDDVCKLSRCHCDYDPWMLICERRRNVEEFYPVLNQTEGLDISLEFVRSRIADIPSDFFQGQKSQTVRFTYCNVRSFGSRPFSGLEDHLKSLYIHQSVHSDVSLPIGHLENLRYFRFDFNNNLKKLGNEWFSGGPESLEEIRIFENGFEEIGDRVFADLINVKGIWFNDNTLKAVSRSMFPRPAKKLFTFSLSYNGLRDLPEDIFDDMPALRSISLSGNKFTTLSEDVFGKIWGQLSYIYFEKNEGFKCDSRMKWILSRQSKRLRLRGNCEPGKSLDEFLKKDPSDIEDEE